MNISKWATAGTLESCDCMVMVKPGEALEIHVDSIVEKIFGVHIRKIILHTLEELHVETGIFIITDRGALDYCLKARVTTAVRRGAEEC